LSKRRLYFTKVQVYFECETALHNEDSWAMKQKDSNTTPEESESDGLIRFRQPNSPQGWARFRNLLENYTFRELSFNADIFNACTGIYNYVYGSTTKRFIFGLPESDFVHALRWYSYQHTARVPELQNFVLPSWSWASCRGSIIWYRGSGWLSYETNEEGPSTSTLVGFQVCLDGNQGWTKIAISNQDEEAASTSAVSKEYPAPISIHLAKPGYLRFRTQSALFGLRDKYSRWGNPNPKHKNCELKIEDRDGNQISSIEIEQQWAEKYVRTNRRYKFVAISAICFPPHWTISHLDRYISETNASIADEVKAYLDSIKHYKTFYMNPGAGKDLHVMLIDSNEDVARRIGVTSLRLVDWLKSDPKMEDIVLK
jgi:hypothetical protein